MENTITDARIAVDAASAAGAVKRAVKTARAAEVATAAAWEVAEMIRDKNSPTGRKGKR